MLASCSRALLFVDFTADEDAMLKMSSQNVNTVDADDDV